MLIKIILLIKFGMKWERKVKQGLQILLQHFSLKSFHAFKHWHYFVLKHHLVVILLIPSVTEPLSKISIVIGHEYFN